MSTGPRLGRRTKHLRRGLTAAFLVVVLVISAGSSLIVAQSAMEPRYEDLPAIAGDDALARAVAAGPDGLVAIGTRNCQVTAGRSRLRCYGEVWTSADGTDWQPLESQASGIDLGTPCESTGAIMPSLIDVTHGPAGYLAVGYAGSKRRCATAAMWSSADGMAWERVEVSGGFPVGFRPSSIIGTQDEFVVAGVVHGLAQDPPAPPRAAVWTSPDGASWSRAKPAKAFGVGGYLNTGEAPDSGGISELTPTPAGYVAVGDACPRSFSGLYLNSFEGLPPPCAGQTWTGIGTQGWSRLDTPAVPDIVDVEAIGERVVAAASVCRECAPLMLVADVEPGDDPGRPPAWAFAYGAPVAGRLLDLAASDDQFWSLMADPDGSSLTLWWSGDGSHWEPYEAALDLPEAMTFDERGGVELVAMADKLVVVGSGATVEDELQRSFAFMVPAIDPAD